MTLLCVTIFCEYVSMFVKDTNDYTQRKCVGVYLCLTICEFFLICWSSVVPKSKDQAAIKGKKVRESENEIETERQRSEREKKKKREKEKKREM